MRPFLLALPLAISCGRPPVSAGDFTTDGEDARLEAADFGCLSGLERVGRVTVRNVLGHQEEALSAARGSGVYPVGTVLQLAPSEAMVKRGAGFSPETGDWEFFILDERRGETTIVDRGTTEPRNIAGSCAGCHAPAAASGHDWVCMSDHGCEPLPGIALKLADRALRKDSRCP
jgi:hypothetical protein